MSEEALSQISLPTREVVGLFSQPGPLLSCVKELLKADFDHSDLSVLATHEAIEATDEDGGSWLDRLMPLLSETRYEVPLLSGALIALASGPAAALIAGIATAGVGLAAIGEVMEETLSLPDSQAFADAVDSGEILLWVRIVDADRERTARTILERHGARNLVVQERS